MLDTGLSCGAGNLVCSLRDCTSNALTAELSLRPQEILKFLCFKIFSQGKSVKHKKYNLKKMKRTGYEENTEHHEVVAIIRALNQEYDKVMVQEENGRNR